MNFTKCFKQLPSLLNQLGAKKTMDFDSEIFQGATVVFSDKKPIAERIDQLLAVPAIKNVWPKKLVPPPVYQIDSVAPHGSEAGSISDRIARRSKFNDTYSTHVQTQVDKLRAGGFTGDGVKIAIVDTGVSFTP